MVANYIFTTAFDARSGLFSTMFWKLNKPDNEDSKDIFDV